MIFKELEIIPSLLDGSNPLAFGISQLQANKLHASANAKNSWLESVAEIASLLDSLSVKYVLIKYLDMPYAYMKDIDLLIEDEKDRHTLFSVLRKNGCTPYRSLFPPHPDKIEFVRNHPYAQIDVYPEPAWWKISYAPKGLISSKRIQKRVLGTKVFVPSPTHEIYLIATHSYAHGTITLAEVAYVTKVILNNQIDWRHLLSIAKHYKLEHAVFIYLFLCNIVTASLGRKNSELQKTLEELGDSRLSRMFKNLILNIEDEGKPFPIIIPKSLRLLSALREILIGLTQKNELSIRELSTYWLLVRVELTRHYKRFNIT